MLLAKRTAGLLSLVLLGACSTNQLDSSLDANTITFNNFEAGGGWSFDAGRNDPLLLDKGRAHSGQYAIKVDQNHEFSLTFDMPLVLIRPKKFKIVHLDAWVFMPSDRATGVLGLQVIAPETGQQVYGDGVKLRDAVKTYKEWVPVSQDFTLPDTVTPLQHLRFSVWRADASDFVLVDDVKLSIKD